MMNSTQPNPSSPPASDSELLSAYLDNQLSIAERLHIERRIEAEPTLRVELESLRATVSALRDLEPVRPPRSFTLDPATVARRRRIFPLAWMMQAGSGLAGMALVLMATVQMFAVGTMSNAPMASKAAPATTEGALPTDSAIMALPQAPAADTRMAQATAAPAAESAPMAAAPTDAAAATAMQAPMVEPAMPTAEAASEAAGMVLASPVPGGTGGAGAGAAPPMGGGASTSAFDPNASDVQASENTSPDTTQLPAAPPPAAAAPLGIPPGLTLVVGVALIGLAMAWYLAGRRT